MIRYEIFDRLHEWSKNYTDLGKLKAIKADLAAFDQATRDELVHYAEGQTLDWTKAGEKAIAELWERYAEIVRRADHG